MNWKKIERLCKSGKVITVQNTPDGQWIGDASSLYPMYGLPEMHLEAVLTLFGVKPNDWDSYQYHEDCVSGINLGDVDDDEKPVVPIGPVMIIGGAEIIALPTREDISFIDTDYLKPVGGDIDGFYERTDAKGRVYIAIKKGFELAGVIYPTTLPMIHKGFPNDLDKIARLMESRMQREGGQEE